MFQKQNSNVKVTITGFDYSHVIAIVRPVIKASQGELVSIAALAPSSNVGQSDKPPMQPGSVVTPGADTPARLRGDCSVYTTVEGQKNLQSTSCRRINLDQPGFLRLKDVLTILPISRAAWYAGIQAGR